MRLDVGVTVLNSDQGQPRRIDKLSDIAIHPDYNGNRNSKYDVAVIKPQARCRTSSRSSSPTPGPETSWRTPRTSRDGRRLGRHTPAAADRGAPSKFPKRMREVTPPLVSDRSCEKAYRGAFYASLMVCAGQTAEDTCQGDSGGPMFVTVNEARRQIGITSFGKGCGAPGFADVYTEVNATSIYNFIRRAANR